MTTVDWVYVVVGSFGCGVIVGYWIRRRLPTAADLADGWTPLRRR